MSLRGQTKCADIIQITLIFPRNPRKLCEWSPLTVWNMFKYLSLNPNDLHTPNCAPIQWAVWPHNGPIGSKITSSAPSLIWAKKLLSAACKMSDSDWLKIQTQNQNDILPSKRIS